MSADDLVWAAGMFEGEGSIMIGTYLSAKGEDVYALHCKVPSTDYDIIAFFKKHWPKSCVTQEARANRQPLRNWILSGENARAFLKQLEPHVRTDRVRSKSKVAYRFMLLKKLCKTDPGNRQNYLDEQRGCYYEMKQLNLRGAAANRKKHEE